MTPASETIQAPRDGGRDRRRGWTASLIVSILCVASVTHADTDAQKRTAAQALFDEARRLVDEGRHDEACPKFRESQSLDPGIGTLYNLGVCLETIGRTASAWAAFREAADMAKIAGQSDRELAARDRAVALEPRLMRLRIEVPMEARVAELVVQLDGIPVGQGQWGVDVPVDPGRHTVSAAATGKVDRTMAVELVTEGATRAVRVEPLEDAAVPPPRPVDQPRPPQPSPLTTSQQPPDRAAADSQETWGWVLGGVGAVGVGVGTILAFGAKSKYDDSLEHCDTGDPNRCDSEGVSLRDDARSRGNYATVAIGLGAAALAGGAVLLITAPDVDDPTAARVETGPMVGNGSAAWMMRGTW